MRLPITVLVMAAGTVFAARVEVRDVTPRVTVRMTAFAENSPYPDPADIALNVYSV